MRQPESRFIKVRCNECDNEQVVFNKVSSVVVCHICGGVIAEPTGGKALIKGKILEVIE